MFFYPLASLLEQSCSPKGPKLTFCHCNPFRPFFYHLLLVLFIKVINLLPHEVEEKKIGWQVLILDPEYNCVAQNMITLICTCALIPMSLNV